MKTKSLIYLVLGLLFATLVISYSSCKKEEDKHETTETVISDETLIAEDNGLENPTVSGNTYTYDYSGSAPDISVGEVIVGQTGDGYMRKVTGVTYQNNQLILETEQAKLTDVIDNCDISDSITLNLGQKSATLNGSPINVVVTGLKEGMTIEEDLVNLSNVVLFSGEVNGVTLEAKITEGYIAFEPVIHRKLKIRPVNGSPTVTEFLLTAEGQLDFVCNVEVTCNGNLSYTPEMDPLLTFWIGPMFFGPIPAFIKFSFTPGFESAFIINGNLTKGYQATATVEFGAQYLYDEGWREITHKNFTFNEDPLQWSLNGNLHAKTWVTPQIDLKLAGVLGPYMNVNPFLGFDGQVNLPQWHWALTGGVDGYLGFDMSLFGWHIVNLNTSIFDWEVVIAEQSGTQAGLPEVATKAVSEITASSAKCGGNISSEGGAAVTARGVCWSTSQNPTTANSHTNDGSGTGQFTSSITGLNANTTYFVRAYATNGEGTAYGVQVSFTTTGSSALPSVTTNTINNITQTTANGGGNVSHEGSSSVTARGVCWSTSQNPTTANSHTNDGSSTGQFTSNITGLNANTAYFVRAYATNNSGTVYGNQVNFKTTSTGTLPSVTTNTISNITQNTASGGGNVSNEGSSSVTARGVCWSTSQNPTVSDNHTTDGSGTGPFTSSITGLNANTTYFVRAYASNSEGTAYGDQLSFNTFSGNQTVIINENFEDYDIGEFPLSGGWQILYNGTGSEDQYISNQVSNSGMKSIRISGTSGWRAEIIHPIPVSSDNLISYQVSFYAVPDDPGGRCSFFNPDVGSWGTSVALIAFYDNVLYINANEVTTYSDNEWVNVKLVYDQVSDLVSVWVNSEQLLANYQIEDNTIPITHFSISTKWGSGSCINYWDDIVVSKEQ